MAGFEGNDPTRMRSTGQELVGLGNQLNGQKANFEGLVKGLQWVGDDRNKFVGPTLNSVCTQFDNLVGLLNKTNVLLGTEASQEEAAANT